MTKTTILQVIPELNTGGAELSAIEISQAVVQAGGRALVMTEGGRMEENLKAVGGEIIKHPIATKNPVRIYKNAKTMADLIKTENIHLIHARSRAPAWSAWLAARRTNCHFVTTYHGAYGNKEPFKNTYNRIMASGDIVIANSEYTANLIREQHKPDESRLRVIHRGVDVDKFNKNNISEERRQILLDQWAIQPGQRIVLQAARLTSWKGQETLIDAVALLKGKESLNNTVFIIAGDEQNRTEYKTMLLDKISEYGLTEHIRLTGHCSDIAAAFAVSFASVVASTGPEAFGRAAVESQALECPVIVTDIGAATETVISEKDADESQQTGWRIPPKNPEILARTLENLLNLNQKNRENMGARAQAHVAKNFSLHQMKFRTLEIYDELIGSNLSHLLIK